MQIDQADIFTQHDPTLDNIMSTVSTKDVGLDNTATGVMFYFALLFLCSFVLVTAAGDPPHYNYDWLMDDCRPLGEPGDPDERVLDLSYNSSLYMDTYKW